jgi:hypothetical protein
MVQVFRSNWGLALSREEQQLEAGTIEAGAAGGWHGPGI